MQSFISVLLFGIFLRWSVSLFPYSGAGKKPMFGDYEAQRHWQEITINLPVQDWYRNTTNNDLMYWGLDYPPLTAYHSYLCGQVAKFIDPQFVALNASKGFESYNHKFFMRFSVFVIDILIYFPAAYYFSKACSKGKHGSSEALLTFSALILYPGLYLIDYGHFQYNNASLGLFILAVALILTNYDILGGISFVLALNYKQMELYHALPLFVFYLGKYYKRNNFFGFLFDLTKISLAVIITFVVVWFPFLFELNDAKQVLIRIFPFNRGLFEDKVASFWCTASIVVKFKLIFDNAVMSLICLGTTGVCLLPSCLHLLFNPSHRVLKYCIINSSLIFFLFSFHVHEKSILLVAIPICFIFHEEPKLSMTFFIISILSMVPLLVRDGLTVAAFSLAIFCLTVPYKSSYQFSFLNHKFTNAIINASIFLMFVLSVLSILVKPPIQYPDLYPVLLSAFACVCYCLFLVYFHYCQYRIAAYPQKFKFK